MSYGKGLNLSQTTILTVMKMGEYVLQKDRKHKGVKRNYMYLLGAISHFLTVFSKDLNCRHTQKKQGLFGNGLTHFSQGRLTCPTNKVCNKETNEKMHGGNIRSRQDSNQGRPYEKPI